MDDHEINLQYWVICLKDGDYTLASAFPFSSYEDAKDYAAMIPSKLCPKITLEVLR